METHELPAVYVDQIESFLKTQLGDIAPSPAFNPAIEAEGMFGKSTACHPRSRLAVADLTISLSPFVALGADSTPTNVTTPAEEVSRPRSRGAKLRSVLTSFFRQPFQADVCFPNDDKSLSGIARLIKSGQGASRLLSY